MGHDKIGDKLEIYLFFYSRIQTKLSEQHRSAKGVGNWITQNVKLYSFSQFVCV